MYTNFACDLHVIVEHNAHMYCHCIVYKVQLCTFGVDDDVITMTTVASLHIGCDNVNCNTTPPRD